MTISRDDKEHIIKELQIELKARFDGGRKNLIVPVCPYCGKAGGKYGIYVGPDTNRKQTFVAHCFSCGHTTKTLEQLLRDIGRSDLIPAKTADFTPLKIDTFVSLEEDEIDDELAVVEMPDGWKRCYRNPYLKGRGFTFDDYDYFPVGTTRGLNFKFDDYVLFPIIDNEDIVGYIGRHIWGKEKIDEYNKRAARDHKFQIRRYNNSTENDFVKLLYNYDSVIEDGTDTVILVEGVFDCIALTRKLDLYDNHRIACCATFGKKISSAQIYKLQSKGVRTVVLGYDGDAVASINKAASTLDEYFDVYIAYIEDPDADFDSMDFWDIYDAFTMNLMTPREYKLNIVQL